MGFLSALGKGLRSAGGAVMGATRVVSRLPGVKAIPYVGTAATVLGAVGGAASILSGGGGRSPGQLPTGLPGLPSLPMGNTGGTGIIPKGPGGRMQLPWNDPSTPAVLKQFALDDQYIRPAMRAPPGYVIVRDADGRPYPLLRAIAIKFRLWKPAKKPPISVRDWQALKRSDRTIKKLRKVHRMMRNIHNGQRPRTGGKKGKK